MEIGAKMATQQEKSPKIPLNLSRTSVNYFRNSIKSLVIMLRTATGVKLPSCRKKWVQSELVEVWQVVCAWPQSRDTTPLINCSLSRIFERLRSNRMEAHLTFYGPMGHLFQQILVTFH